MHHTAGDSSQHLPAAHLPSLGRTWERPHTHHQARSCQEGETAVPCRAPYGCHQPYAAAALQPVPPDHHRLQVRASTRAQVAFLPLAHRPAARPWCWPHRVHPPSSSVTCRSTQPLSCSLPQCCDCTVATTAFPCAQPPSPACALCAQLLRWLPSAPPPTHTNTISSTKDRPSPPTPAQRGATTWAPCCDSTCATGKNRRLVHGMQSPINAWHAQSIRTPVLRRRVGEDGNMLMCHRQPKASSEDSANHPAL